MQPFKWSNASLSLLSSCAEAFRRRYLEREYPPSSPRQIRGRVVHTVAQGAYARSLQQHALPSQEEAQDMASTAFDVAWAEGVQLEPAERAAGEAVTKGESRDFAVDLSGYHVTRVAPSVQPIAVEERITAQLPESDVLVHGVVDLIDLQPDGTHGVRDLKTGEKAPNANAANTSLQLTIYASLLRAEMGMLPSRLILDHIVRTPVRKQRSYIPLVTVRDEEDLRVLGARVQTAVSLVEKGVFLPAPADAWQCSERYCPYWSTCRFVRRGERRPVT